MFRFLFRLIKNILRLTVLLILIAGLLFCYSKYIEPEMLKEEKITISSSYIDNEADGVKIALFGDTHFSENYTVEDFKKIIDSIAKEKPDIIFFSGDLFDNYNNYSEHAASISEALYNIEAPLGKFAIFGNHDYGGGAENHYEDIMSQGGFVVLKNEYYALDSMNVGIIGIDDVVIGYGNPEIAGWGREDYYNIVLSHAPDIVDQMLTYNTDLMLSGHTHGRQINISYFDEYILPKYGKKYIKGLYEFENTRNTNLYVNPGVGTTKLPYRFLSKPEITYITLEIK